MEDVMGKLEIVAICATASMATVLCSWEYGERRTVDEWTPTLLALLVDYII